ncbi:uncharacterized protein LOC117241156 isoform X1 [Bombus vosnesenskii]|uniref:Uncharacterized protein LOC117241156 isoform X1 n=1 Tax=Bombus vosnesenskii TaxID=207650 RepID=A0A6J3LBM3_9HYME|nr:uncharacterized protein LOC117241156 isoform X1 [Bombus vosnesenskii]XP_033363023.1 uncharacterized protein LOC117241156 isoform X1 [Bombus vosnesenskii]
MLSGFLVKRLDNTYMYFHPSFREWLMNSPSVLHTHTKIVNILLFRCCVTYLDRSHNIIRFFDMPWLLTTAAFYYGCLPSWLLYMVFRKQGAITYFARKPSRMMITCSQGVHYLYYSTNSVTPPFDLSTI